ncbi:MAG: hypothetical protein IAE78_14910 [Myxococcus sp.]|nr:hypothetical protein [Myxococcus sp.]
MPRRPHEPGATPEPPRATLAQLDAQEDRLRVELGQAPREAPSPGRSHHGEAKVAAPAPHARDEALEPPLPPGSSHAREASGRSPGARPHEATGAPPGSPQHAPPSRQQALGAARVLAHQVAALLGADVKVLLSVHDNRSTMISFRREPPLLRLRVHHLFLEAPHEVVVAIADYAGRGKRAAGRVLDEYIAERQERIRAEARRASALNTRGKCFDLAEVFHRLNHLYFQDSIRARIGWGRNASKRRRKSIRLGVYDHRSREIRVHPALDRPDVPLFFVEYIVFHEMLHQVFPSARDSGRHVHHPRAFRDRERAFPRYAAAIAWEKEHLHALLRR